MSLPVFVQEFKDLVDSAPDEFGWRIHAQLARVIKVYETEPVIVEMERYEKYIALGDHLGVGQGFEWERLLIGCMLCTYRADGLPRWKFLFDCSGRGAGKDVAIEWMSYCLISPYNPVPKYDIDIFGFVEDQATRPVKDLVEVLSNGDTAKFKKHFYWTAQMVKGLKNGGTIKGHANNPKAGDGLRSGCVIYNEVHAYENNAQLDVGISGLGKVQDARQMYFTTNGNVVGGPFDNKMADCDVLLKDPEADDKGMFYFVWALDSKDEVDDERMWNKANPSLRYFPTLLEEIRTDYETWKRNPADLPAFMTKRMNIRQTFEESPAAEWDDIEATNRSLPLEKLRGQSCVCGIDFSQTTDWVGVNLHFVDEHDVRYDINHAWICKQSRTNWRLKCPYEDWARDGHLTIVNEPEIDPNLIADYVGQMMRSYRIEMVVIDSYRYALLSRALERVGFSTEMKNIKMYRPSDIMRTVPVITSLFAKRLFCWGDNPVLRWATNNTKKVPAKRSVTAVSGEIDMGNWLYDKIEWQARKTDPFMALVASMTEESRVIPITQTVRKRPRVTVY